VTRTVVVTGLGAISSAGPDTNALREAVATGRCCLTEVQDARYQSMRRTMAGFVDSPLDQQPALPEDWPQPDRFVHLAVIAAEQAVQQAGIDPVRLGTRIGAVVGTCSGPTRLLEEHYQRILRGGGHAGPDQAFRLAYESAVRALARRFNIRGFTATVTTACSASLTAIGTGLDLIRANWCDAVIVGGADAFNLSTQIGFDGLKAPSDGPCAPFSKPVGLCLGEGSAFLVMESLEYACARGATILASVLGFGTSNDAYHSSSPDPSGRGQALAVLRALQDAGVPPSAVAYVNAHGTGTQANDKAETKVVRRVFGAVADHVPVSTQKAVFGHTLGAAGAVELTGAILCRQAGTLPPTAGFQTAREGCDLDYVAESGRPVPRDRPWVKENFAFGGHNAALVLGDTPGPESPPARPQTGRACLVSAGLVSSAGAGIAAFERLLAGSGPKLQECAPPGHAPFQAALAPDELDAALERRLGLRRMDKATAMCTVAAYQALREAGISLRPESLTEVGLFLGHASGSNAAEASFLPELLRHDYVLQRVTDFTQVVPNATGGAVCRTLGLRGHNAVFSFGAGAGLMSLLMGACAIKNGHSPFLLAGAVDMLSARGWGHPLPDTQAPPTEAAAFFLLESEEHLRERGGHALAIIDGISVATETTGWNEFPSDATAEAVAASALEQAGLDPNAVDSALHPVQDVSGRTGWAEACAPLFNIAATLIPNPQTDGALHPKIISISTRQGISASLVYSPISDVTKFKAIMN
jgi:3-oxoacyl-[acyl-carrier-protein] synthase II